MTLTVIGIDGANHSVCGERAAEEAASLKSKMSSGDSETGCALQAGGFVLGLVGVVVSSATEAGAWLFGIGAILLIVGARSRMAEERHPSAAPPPSAPRPERREEAEAGDPITAAMEGDFETGLEGGFDPMNDGFSDGE